MSSPIYTITNASAITTQTVSDASTATLATATTDALLTSMTLTPAVGTYVVMFNADCTSATAGAAVSFSVYVGGVQNANSLRKIIPFSGGTLTTGNARGSISTLAQVTVNGSQAITIEWSTSTAPVSCGPRTLLLLKVG